MIEPTAPENEKARLQALLEYEVLDTLEEEDYDNITQLASAICETPISLVSLLDDKRQWFKSHHGLEVSETPKDFAFCAHAIVDPTATLSVEDARLDERFKENPLVKGDPRIVFYTGVPLVNPEGFPLGTLCVIDRKPKLLDEDQIRSLRALAKQVVNLLELRKANRSLTIYNRKLDEFASAVEGELGSPLNDMASLTSLLYSVYSDKLDDDGTDILNKLKDTSQHLRKLISALLEARQEL